MSEFRFKQFSVKNEASAMKVGTDAVLLGAAMTLLPYDRSLLDVGTGTGVIALMAAQRLAALPTDSRPVTDMSAATVAESLPADACPAIGIPPASAFQIEAIDIDPASAAEAAENFAASPWSAHLRAHCIPLSAYRLVDTPADSADRPGEPTSFPNAPTNSHCTALSASHAAATNHHSEPAEPVSFPFACSSLLSASHAAATYHHTEPAEPVSFPFACSSLLSASHAAPIAPTGFDLIFSNPPYYDSSLKNPDARESAARHTETLSYRELCAFAEAHLKPEGRLSLILPADCEKDLLRTAASFGLYPFRLLRIRTTPAKPVSRLIAEFSRTRIPVPCLTTDPHQPGHTSPQVASAGPHQPDHTSPQVAADGPHQPDQTCPQVASAGPHQPDQTCPQVATAGPHQPDQTCPQVATTGPQPSDHTCSKAANTAHQLAADACSPTDHPSAQPLATPFPLVAELTLMDPAGSRSSEYASLTNSFYL